MGLCNVLKRPRYIQAPLGLRDSVSGISQSQELGGSCLVSVFLGAGVEQPPSIRTPNLALLFTGPAFGGMTVLWYSKRPLAAELGVCVCLTYCSGSKDSVTVLSLGGQVKGSPQCCRNEGVTCVHPSLQERRLQKSVPTLLPPSPDTHPPEDPVLR